MDLVLPKDVFEYIANFVDDREIVLMLSRNKQYYYDDELFHRILMRRYELLLKFKFNRTYKQLFLDMVRYIDKLNRKYGIPYNPTEFYNKYKDDPNIYNYASIEAAKGGHLDIVKQLLGGENININNILPEASMNGHLEVVKYLVEHGANINANNDAALRFASQYGHLDVVKYLVEQGANIHAKNDEALKWASQHGQLDVVKYLVEHDANIHTYDDFALKWANKNNHIDVINYLKSLP